MITYHIGDKDSRPWGTWEVIDVGNNYIVKRICVMPGKRLSLQMHHHRDEHWIITEGTALVTINDTITSAPANTAVFIPVLAKHRITNETDAPVVFIEVQAGLELDESDIVRFEDDFGRV